MFPLRLRSLSLLFVAAACHAQTLQLTPVNPTGVYSAGEPIAWTVTVTGDAAALQNARYKLKLNGGDTLVAEGALDLTQPGLRFEAPPLDQPGTLLAELTANNTTATDPQKKTVKALGGAVVDHEKIPTILSRPADFDAFWATQRAALAAVPANVKLEPVESGRADVEYFKVTFD
ncbi:MAG: hypothetical protein H7067_06270, partial [Burkholderiales bacterium]|nr:hypothetical protein [Opitutaceae bacterium]